jgi:hypothetical protein
MCIWDMTSTYLFYSPVNVNIKLDIAAIKSERERACIKLDDSFASDDTLPAFKNI